MHNDLVLNIEDVLSLSALLALQLAQRAVELSGGIQPHILDTLALALFQTGEVEAAVETQRRAVELSPDREDYRESLARFETALDSDAEVAATEGEEQ